MTAAIRIAAPAKLNLFLHITGKRPDGYHLMESLAAFTAFGDVIEVTPSDTITLALSGPFATVLDGDDNIVLRAARLLQERTRCGKGARITLHKHIPVGAGLGGGSADAAAALCALEALWEVTPGDGARQEMALKLGSDVPVCLVRRPVVMRGIGDRVTEVNVSADAWADIGVVLVNPRLPLLTADVYRRFAGRMLSPSSLPEAFDSLNSLIRCIGEKHNALEATALSLRPVIGDMLAALRTTGGCVLARMSGSGATCFGLYDGIPVAQQAARKLQQANPAWWVQATSLLAEA